MTIMACTGGLSRESLYYGQQAVLLSELKTSDVKYMAMEIIKKEIRERQGKTDGAWEIMIIRGIILKRKLTISAICFSCFLFHWQRRGQE